MHRLSDVRACPIPMLLCLVKGFPCADFGDGGQA
jgi:hypothetical protein